MIAWRCAPWFDITRDELYAILQLRTRVFSVEQACAYQDLEGLDQRCDHLWALDGERIMAYLRILPPGLSYDEPSLGRLVVAPEARGTGLGRALTARGIDELLQRYPGAAIRIGAQAYLERFYGDFGFARASSDYLEDGIPHLAMLRAAGAKVTP